MAGLLDQVTSIVLVMMENRSFDHLLGHLTIDDPTLDIDGLKPPFDKYNNDFNATAFPIYPRDTDDELPNDVPHEHDFVATQVAYNAISDTFAMNGFVTAYAQSTGIPPSPQCEPMGYFPEKFLPMTEFLATKFCCCDRWFCPIPTSTQPNRTMAFSGDSSIFETKTQPITIKNDLFHWLDNHKVRWRVYHEGFSFFSLYPDLWPYVLGPQFRRYENLYSDILHEPAAAAPQVIIIEPCYEDAPHLGKQPDDNHAPLAIAWGEDFLRRTYQAITANPDKYKGTLMILYSDEHGGFYDHVQPERIPYKTIGKDPHQFTSTGPRVPAILISPLVKPGQPCHLLFDHTSVLQLINEKFGVPGVPYSDTVENRRKAGIQSVSAALNNAVFAAPPAEPTTQLPATTALGKHLTTPPESNMEIAFELAGQQLLAQKPAETRIVYPELVQWEQEAAKSGQTPAAVNVSSTN